MFLIFRFMPPPHIRLRFIISLDDIGAMLIYADTLFTLAVYDAAMRVLRAMLS